MAEENVFTGKEPEWEEVTVLNIPEGTVEIAPGAMSGRKNLKEVTLPSTCRRIGNLAFSECTGLEKLTLNDGLQEIGDCAFLKCWNLHCLDIPDSIEKIGKMILLGTSLERLTIRLDNPSAEVRPDAFAGCRAHKVVVCAKELHRNLQHSLKPCRMELLDAPNIAPGPMMPEYLDAAFKCFLETDPRESRMPPDIRTLWLKYLNVRRRRLVHDPAAMQVILRERLIKPKEFEAYLERAETPEEKAALLAYAQDPEYQRKLEKVREAKEKRAMQELETGLPNLTETRKTWTWNYVDGCVSLKSWRGTDTHIVIPPAFGTPDRKVVMIGPWTFSPQQRYISPEIRQRRSDIVSVEIPDTVEYIGNYAFRGCTKLERIILPENVKLGRGVFLGCDRLENRPPEPEISEDEEQDGFRNIEEVLLHVLMELFGI